MLGRVNALRAVGGESPLIALGGHDALEGNDTLAAARPIALGTTVRPNIYPAGDVDVFAVDAPRAGRLEISVGPVLDSRAWPWNKSSLAIDPVLNVYDANGTHLVTVDDNNPAVTDRASIQMNAAGRLLVRIHNYTPNGNRGTYPLTTVFIDNIAPTAALALAPTARAAYDGPVVTTFSEPVTGVSGSTFQLRRGGVLVPASVSYDADDAAGDALAQRGPGRRRGVPGLPDVRHRGPRRGTAGAAQLAVHHWQGAAARFRSGPIRHRRRAQRIDVRPWRAGRPRRDRRGLP